MDENDRLQRARRLEAESVDEFQTAHEEGMAALARRDYSAVAKAISDESAAIETHKDAIEQSNDAFSERAHDDDSTAARPEE